jgi:hypothetical protein
MIERKERRVRHLYRGTRECESVWHYVGGGMVEVYSRDLFGVSEERLGVRAPFEDMSVESGCLVLTNDNSWVEASALVVECESLMWAEVEASADTALVVDDAVVTIKAGKVNVIKDFGALCYGDEVGVHGNAKITRLDLFYNGEMAVSEWKSGAYGRCDNLDGGSSVLSGVASLDLSGWNLEGLTDLRLAFCGCEGLTDIRFGSGWGRQTSTAAEALVLDLSRCGSACEYVLTDATWSSLLVMHDRLSAGLTEMTVRVSERHNVPDGWAAKMAARGYVVEVARTVRAVTAGSMRFTAGGGLRFN